MAKLGGGIVEINGAFSGNVYRRDQCGQHVEAHGRFVGRKNPTAEQRLQRACFRDCIYAWQSRLTFADRLEWAIYATRHLSTNKKGEKRKLLGWNWFLKINLVRVRNGLAIITVPPFD